MSSNVIDFGTKKSLVEIQELKKTLQFCYSQVEQTYECLDEMEANLELIQQNYNQLLVEIAQKYGTESVTIDDLDHATNLSITNNGDGTLSVNLNGVVAGSWSITEAEE